MKNESTSRPPTPGDAAGRPRMESDADYRIREMEARLDRRLAVLEAGRIRARWSARLTGAGVTLALAAVTGLLWILLSDDRAWQVGSLSTEEVVLVDPDGFTRGRLATDAEGRSELTLSDRDGRERIRLTVLADGSPGVTLSDPDARPRAILGYLPDGTTNLVLADARGTSRAVFGVEPDGSTQALFADRSGRMRTLVGVGADGSPSVSVFEEAAEDESSPTP
ncbi:MAG: hypothetical protein R3223_00440 [Longimicrobiales bacterium]|nr:hypothetical protein [Longimicrobiales bacterium]